MSTDGSSGSLRRCSRLLASLGILLSVILISARRPVLDMMRVGVAVGGSNTSALSLQDTPGMIPEPAEVSAVLDIPQIADVTLPPNEPAEAKVLGLRAETAKEEPQEAEPGSCNMEELAEAAHSTFAAESWHEVQVAASPDPGSVSRWFRLGLIRSCCSANRCHQTGGDVFLAFLEGADALSQPVVHDFGNGSYAILLAADTLLPSASYTLTVYLHQSLNRQIYRNSAAPGAAWPRADPSGLQSLLDFFNLPLSASKPLHADLRYMYVHLKADIPVKGTPVEVHWAWPGLGIWTTVMAGLKICPRQTAGFLRREGGFWLRVGERLNCSSLGEKGCGELGVLPTNSEFHHMYVERSCYYPVRNAATIRSCLKQQRVVFLGDSTTRGLVYEAMVMWSDTKPYKNYENKSDVCMYRERMMPVRGGKRLVGTWESSQCSSKGDVAVADVTFGGHSMIHSPEWSYLRQPRCMGMGNLADRQAGEKFAKQLKPFNIAVIHSCDHDLCNRFNAKPKMLEQYRLNLRRLAKLLRKHAKGKRIIWLSCAAQGNLGKNAYYTQTHIVKWRMDRLALEACRENGWEFVDGFSLTSTALPHLKWWEHRGKAGDVHTHSHCCPLGNRSDLLELAKTQDELAWLLAWQGGVGYLSKTIVQVVFNQICAPT